MPKCVHGSQEDPDELTSTLSWHNAAPSHIILHFGCNLSTLVIYEFGKVCYTDLPSTAVQQPAYGPLRGAMVLFLTQISPGRSQLHKSHVFVLCAVAYLWHSIQAHNDAFPGRLGTTLPDRSQRLVTCFKSWHCLCRITQLYPTGKPNISQENIIFPVSPVFYFMDWISSFPVTRHVLEYTQKQLCAVLRSGSVPQHIGFIMDGNRRYARMNKMETKEGHSAGFDTMARLLEVCYDCGVQAATVFAFSIENFNRSEYEIEWLMKLAKSKMKQVVDNGELCHKYGVKIRILGNLKLLPADVRESLLEAQEMTKNNARAVLNICCPYTARDDITHAIKNIIARGHDPEDITQDLVSENLYTAGVPKLQLLIRTSGVYRLSDFMLWEAVDEDCDVEILSVLWPQFTPLLMLWVLFKWGWNRAGRARRNKRLLVNHGKDD
ncbi:hypothetical protein KL948_003695 [Ogataea haglerorum]|nr:hypothetical protein KL948_003695 [Ogataea haglerorum]